MELDMGQITIQENKLEIWARYIQLNKNKETYERVKNIFRKRTFEIYLQGSVANNTNIRADGDIDIVLQFNEIFYYKYDYQPKIYNNPSNYTQREFREEVKKILDEQTISYKEKNKCIKLNLGGEHWQDVDLIPCFQYKNHWGSGKDDYYEGIKIETVNDEIITNYPKLHKANGETKNGETKNYKKVIRIFKNIKIKLIEDNKISKKLAPSYFIECLLYNVPNEKFNENTYQSIVANCINWINNIDLNDLKCQNRITDLFGDEKTQWNLENCKTFIDETIKYLTKKR